MRIIVIDSDTNFGTTFANRCKTANVYCQVFSQVASALAALKKDPDSIDLVLIARELSGGQDGLTIARTIRQDPKLTDVPYVIMSSDWSKSDFAKHQKTEFGANAYYSKKSPYSELEATVEAVTGEKKFSLANSKPAAPAGTMLNVQLQAASEVVNFSEELPDNISMAAPINLFPDAGAAPEPEMVAPPATPTPPTINTSSGISIEVPKAIAPTPVATPATPVAPTAVVAPPTPTIEAIVPAVDYNQVSVPVSIGVTEHGPDEVSVGKESGSQESAADGISFSFGIETAQTASAPISLSVPESIVVAADPVPVVESSPASEVAADGGIEISFGDPSLQIESNAKQSNGPIVQSEPGISLDQSIELSLANAGIDLSSPSVALQPPVEPAEVTSSVASEIIMTEGAFLTSPTATPVVSAESPPPEPQTSSGVTEEEAANDLPYLFAGNSLNIGPGAAASAAGSGTSANITRSTIMPSMPLATSSVGGNDGGSSGASSNEVETLKKYLTMREQDVAVLTAQLSYAKEELGKFEQNTKRQALENEDLHHQIRDLKEKIEKQDQELSHASKNKEGEIEQLRFEVKSKIDRIKFLEERLNDSAQQYEKLKDRVRVDIRKIRVREKELESKLEILKKDSETLIAARENKILELKRKIDLLEFNYDTLQDQKDLERQNVIKANEKIERVHKVLKLAVGIIEADEDHGASDEKTDPGMVKVSPKSKVAS